MDLLRAAGELLARAEERSLAIHDEADLRTSAELLPEWSAFVRLADDCDDGLPVTALERRFAVFRKLALPGGQNRFHFAEVARGLGYDIELSDIEELRPFLAESSQAEDPCYEDEAAFVAIVHAPEFTPRFARTGVSVCGEPLVTSGNDLLECTLDEIKPAHVLFLYLYDKPYTGYAPWNLETPPATPVALVLPIPSRT